jgi:hypothetical protein
MYNYLYLLSVNHVVVQHTSNTSKRTTLTSRNETELVPCLFVCLFSLFVKNETRLNGQQGPYLVATTAQSSGEANGNQTAGRVIIAKAHPPNGNSQINANANNMSGPV